jgi:hypothetical protein
MSAERAVHFTARSPDMTLIRLLGLVAIGGIAMKLARDRRHASRRRQVSPPASIERWENEGGAVPISSGTTAARVSPQAENPT